MTLVTVFVTFKENFVGIDHYLWNGHFCDNLKQPRTNRNEGHTTNNNQSIVYRNATNLSISWSVWSTPAIYYRNILSVPIIVLTCHTPTPELLFPTGGGGLESNCPASVHRRKLFLYGWVQNSKVVIRMIYRCSRASGICSRHYFKTYCHFLVLTDSPFPENSYHSCIHIFFTIINIWYVGVHVLRGWCPWNYSQAYLPFPSTVLLRISQNVIVIPIPFYL